MIPPGIAASTARVRAPVTVLGDASYASVTSRMRFNGANGSTAFVDQTGLVWSVNGNAQLSTTSPKFGAASALFDGSGDYLQYTGANLLGAGDFTVEMWVKPANTANDMEFLGISNGTGFSNYDFLLEMSAGGTLRASVRNNGTILCDFNTGSGLTAGAWTHVACVANSATCRVYINGVQAGSAAISGTRGATQTVHRIGYLDGAVPRYMNGNIDDLRVTKGVCRYPSGTTFTPPAAELPYVKAPVFSSRFSTTTGPADAQGVCTDGTNIWYSNSTTIYKYTMAGTLVTSRVVSGDNPTTKNQINGLYIRNGRLYVSAAEFTGGVGISYIVEYDPTTLAYITHHQLSGDHFSEGLAWRDGHWWVVFHANGHVCKVDTNFVVRATYPLTFSITGSSGGYGAGTGYDGVVWVGDYLLCNIHEIYNEDFLDVYLWNGSGFTEVCRLPRATTNGTQGICINPSAPTELYYAERNYSGVDAVAKTILT